ncbi:hypothetical protein D041_4156B, partial [Vibrio parahaemolyticus EKP-008]
RLHRRAQTQFCREVSLLLRVIRLQAMFVQTQNP